MCHPVQRVYKNGFITISNKIKSLNPTQIRKLIAEVHQNFSVPITCKLRVFEDMEKTVAYARSVYTYFFQPQIFASLFEPICTTSFLH